MKLYLSSYRLGNRQAELEQMVAGRKRMGVVRNALDFSTDEVRLSEGRERQFNDLRQLGLHPEEIDLRDYFGSPGELRRVVDPLDGLWVVGGNSFILRRAMQQSGLDNILLERAQDPEFVYAGYSAGVCVVTPTLHGIHLVDFPEVVPEGYDPGVIWDGLGFVPFSIAPHYRSDHPESPMIEAVVTFFIDHKIPFIALRDGDVHLGDTGNISSVSIGVADASGSASP
jgi:dipeptidase E